MDVASKLRQIRGERSRGDVVREIYDRTGILISPQQLYNVDSGRQVLRVSATVRGLMGAYPEIAPLFLGEDLVRSIVSHYRQCSGH